MVGMKTVVAVCITLFISLLLPLVVYVIYGIRNPKKGVWEAWLLGAAGFFVMQIIIRTPILNVLSLNQSFLDFAKNHYVMYCFDLALTAALFEVVGRYLVAKVMSKKLTFERSFAAGLGHGGIEAIIIVGMAYINNIIYIALINTGGFDSLVAQSAGLGVDISSLVAVKDALIGTKSYIFLLAGYERILTMIAHVALSMLVCYFVSRKKDLTGILICLALHFVMDFVSSVVSGMATSYLGNMISSNASYAIIYVFLTAVAAAAVMGIRYFKKKFNA